MLLPLLTSLRAATHELHVALEQTPCMARLQADDLQRSDVARVLQVLAAGFSPIEAQLAGLAWYRPQLPAIASDLTRVSAPPLVLHAAGLDVPDPAARIGAAYVLTGSRMGVRSIRKQLASHLGADFVLGSAYYGGEGDFAKAQWDALMGAMAAIPVGGADERAAVEAGVGAFRVLQDLALQAGTR